MLKILIVGGYKENDKNLHKDIPEFAKLLGEQIIVDGHILLSACRSSLDKIIAESAYNKLIELDKDPKERLISYITKNSKPVHEFGTIRESQLHDWELGSPDLKIPEPINLADVVIFLGGSRGTHRAANWARIAGKSLLPISRFGGASSKLYYSELKQFEVKYGATAEKDDYELLSDIGLSFEELAEKVISLGENIKTSDNVFVIMSFSGDDALEDAFDTFKSVCELYEYTCSRVDDTSADVVRIIPEITKRIEDSAFCIIDLSEPSLNIYYEFGYVDALEKPFIVTAKEGTKLPFDVADVPVIFWKSQKELREKLDEKIKVIAEKHGR